MHVNVIIGLRLSLHCANEFLTFLCETVELGEEWVRGNLEVRCWEGRHLRYTLTASLPSLLAWDRIGLRLLKSKRSDGQLIQTGLGIQKSIQWEVNQWVGKVLASVVHGSSISSTCCSLYCCCLNGYTIPTRNQCITEWHCLAWEWCGQLLIVDF